MLPTLPTRRDVEQTGLGQPIEERAGALPEHRGRRLPDKGKPTAEAGALSRGARNVGYAEGGAGLAVLQPRLLRLLPQPVRLNATVDATVAVRRQLKRALVRRPLREL